MHEINTIRIVCTSSSWLITFPVNVVLVLVVIGAWCCSLFIALETRNTSMLCLTKCCVTSGCKCNIWVAYLRPVFCIQSFVISLALTQPNNKNSMGIETKVHEHTNTYNTIQQSTINIRMVENSANVKCWMLSNILIKQFQLHLSTFTQWYLHSFYVFTCTLLTFQFCERHVFTLITMRTISSILKSEFICCLFRW